VASAGKNGANIREQGLKISGKRIAGLMEMPHHLIQNVSQSGQLNMDKAIGAFSLRFAFDRCDILRIEKDGTAKVSDAHAERERPALDALELVRRQAQIEPGRSCFGFFGSGHDKNFRAERMRPGVWGP